MSIVNAFKSSSLKVHLTQVTTPIPDLSRIICF